MDYAIKVENLGKRYVIGHDRGAGRRAYRYYSLRESLYSRARGLYQRLRHPLSPNRETTELEDFWALKDVNFEIKPGERVGIIGRNGAGKSTLLKLLSRITEPTTGSIDLNGRVASLLEVGTGFHPELTGRENIFLNGAILGMTRAEIKRKFDEIVAFAEVEKFLDTPVKHYSSGMYVRLAFAVAAHLEPEILLVDEVLAVGDAQFQKKCLGKMEDVSKEGRTVLFVSHNMAAIQRLCNHGILLRDGYVVKDGKTQSVLNQYQTDIEENTKRFIPIRKIHSSDKGIRITNIALANENGEFFNQKMIFNIEVTADISAHDLNLATSVFDVNNNCIGTSFCNDGFSIVAATCLRLTFLIPSIKLIPGHYYWGFSVGMGNAFQHRYDYDIVLGFPFEIKYSQNEPYLEWNPSWGNILIDGSKIIRIENI